MTPTNEQGQESQEPPCIFLDENGKHPWTVWHHNHREGYKFWVPTCPHCGYVDTDGILEEIDRKGLMFRPSPSGKTSGLEPLGRDELERLIYDTHVDWNAKKMAGGQCKTLIVTVADAILAKFGTGKETVKLEDIEKVIDNFTLTITVSDTKLKNEQLVTKTGLAKAILATINGGIE